MHWTPFEQDLVDVMYGQTWATLLQLLVVPDYNWKLDIIFPYI